MEAHSEVWKYWRLAPTEAELRVRRLRLIREFIVDIETHQQIVAALFGDIAVLGAGPVMDNAGRELHVQ